jgi:threonylcarbamoyladenosine tRNA methylthiotransferase MtaB
MTSFSIRNFGCRVNQAEAFDWAWELQEHGFRLEKNFERSHVVVVNTCTLTGRADRDARKFIRRILRLNPDAKVVATGCLAERNPAELENIPGIWRVIPNSQKAMLAGHIHSGEDANREAGVVPFRARALVKVQDGCNMSCSFCIIPRVRGRSVSAPREKVLSRVKQLAENGFAEIVLTGIHLCSYGLDFEPRSSLLGLLQDIEALDQTVRIRLSSLDPRLLPLPLLKHLTTSNKICPHFHLSLQHGSEAILARMGRRSTPAEYRDILMVLRENSPRAGIGADLIVGFPGETERDFERIVKFVLEVPLTYFHVFSYSPRPGTGAAAWPQVSDQTKKERAGLLRKISRQKNLAFRSLFLGQELEAVVIERTGGTAEVLTSNYIQVRVPACQAEPGKPVVVRPERITDRDTTGIIVDR